MTQGAMLYENHTRVSGCWAVVLNSAKDCCCSNLSRVYSKTRGSHSQANLQSRHHPRPGALSSNKPRAMWIGTDEKAIWVAKS